MPKMPRAKTRQIIELCAGTAAVSLAAVGLPRFPASRIGNKAGYVDAILGKMGIERGSCHAALLVELDAALATLMEQLVLHPGAVYKAAKELLKLGPREAWERAGDGKFYFSESTRAARTLVRMAGSRGGVGGFRGEHKLRPTANGIPFSLLKRIRAFRKVKPPFDEDSWVVCFNDANEFSPFSLFIRKHAVVYIDAPYEGREPFGEKLSVPVQQLAVKWAAYGFPVYVSEAKPLPLATEFWDITKERKGQKRRSLTKSDHEFLNYFHPDERREAKPRLIDQLSE